MVLQGFGVLGVWCSHSFTPKYFSISTGRSTRPDYQDLCGPASQNYFYKSLLRRKREKNESRHLSLIAEHTGPRCSLSQWRKQV